MQMNEIDDTRQHTALEIDTNLEKSRDTSDSELEKKLTIDSGEQSLELTDIEQRLVALQELFEKQIARNQNQTEMFDKLHAEMKDYKESFLLEVLHKPIIHNLIQLYDSFVALESQFDDICSGKDKQLHKTRKVIPSDDPEQDQKIAEVHKIGFYWREKVFRPEEVTIYRYTTSTQQPNEIEHGSPSNKKGRRTDG